MINKLTTATVLLGLALGIGIAFAVQKPDMQPALSGGTGTLNQLSQWIVSGGNVKLSSTTATLRVPFLASCDTIDTDGDGVFSCGTDGGGGGSGSGSVGTSTALVDTYVTYATGVSTIGAESAFTYDDSTNLLTVPNASTTLISGVTAWFTNFVGDLTGNADTASTLATARTIAGVSFDGSTNISLNNNAITNGAGYTTNTGTVTSIAQTVPTGFSISGSPITTSGTLALTYSSGYAGVLTASTTNWNGFYNTPSTRITAGTGLSWSGNTLNSSGGGTAVALSVETPSGTVNGSNTAFTVTNDPSLVTVNGQAMSITDDYTYSDPIITFVTAPETGSVLRSYFGGGVDGFTGPLNSILTYNGTSVISTSSNPLYIGSLTATTTATSTFGGGVKIGTSNIFDQSGTTTIRTTNGFDFGDGTHGMRIIPGATTTIVYY